MHKKYKKWAIFFIFNCIFNIFSPLIAQAEEGQASETTVADFSAQVDINVDSAMAIDAQTGQILYEQNADQLHGIASLTKLVSLYVVYDAIAAGELDLNTKIPVSKAVAELSQTEGYANVPLEESTDFYTAESLIDATIIGSANAAIVALAEYIAGSEASFVTLMKDKLVELGITDYEIYTASGMSADHLVTGGTAIYDSSYENQMRAKDILFLARELVRDYPEIQERSQVAKKEFQVNTDETYEMTSFNKFLSGLDYARDDVYGLKTGTETLTGACIIAITTIADREVYIVTLGADSDEARYTETGKLMDYLKENLMLYPLQQKGDEVFSQDNVSVSQGVTDGTALVFGKDISLFLPKNYNTDQGIQITYEKAWQYNSDGRIVLTAPVSKDDQVNKSDIKVDFYDSLLRDSQLTNTIQPTENVSKINWVVRTSRIMSDMFHTWIEQLFETN